MKRMPSRIVTACVLVLSLPALAGPRKVLVLPLDGTADPGTRGKLTKSVQKLARVLDGQVKPGDTTFSDTAAVVGCDPATPSCSEDVRSMLQVDELVYGTATKDGDKVTVVVRRKIKGTSGPRELSVTMAAQDPAERVEPSLLPLFSGAAEPGTQSETVTPPTPTDTTTPTPTGDTTTPTDTTVTAAPDGQVTATTDGDSKLKRNLSIAAIGGGGVVFLIGLSLWSSKSSLQDEIDNHPTDTLADFQDLKDLESKASSRAWLGNLFVLGGLALAGYGGWTFYQDRKARRATVTPAPVEGGGAAVTITFVGGLP
ncbi:MAG TPA: hypothetical protein VFQ53_13270 [Kofleriaceae bacterium]|nr:hypothetical protein [Kofleriaceae bacterium]